MIANFEAFCTLVFILIDDIWQVHAPRFRRPGPDPRCSDSELLTIILVSECKGWDNENEWLDHWQPYLDLFPAFPERSRLNRRRRNLSEAVNFVRRQLLMQLDIAQDDLCLIDSLPVEVVKFHLVPSARGDWWQNGARFGRVSSKKQTIFGYKLYLLLTFNGLIVDFVLAPANADERVVADGLLSPYTDLTVLGDKGFINQQWQLDMQRTNRIKLVTLPRRNQKRQISRAAARLINRVRQLIESVNNQLADQFNIEQTRARSFAGLATRLHAKLAAHTLSLLINRLLGAENLLHIKRLAFPSS